MAPLPENGTGRVWLKYATGGGTTSQEHEVMLRYADGLGGSPIGLANVLAGLVTSALGANRFFDGWKAVSMRAAAAGSNISFPLTLPGSLVTFVGAGQTTATRVEQAREAAWEGRSLTTGRRGSFSFYGLATALFPGQDFREAYISEGFVADVLDYIDEMDTGYFVALDGSRLTYAPYCNWQFNSHWETELRA